MSLQRLTRVILFQNWAKCPLATIIDLNVTIPNKRAEELITLTGYASVSEEIPGEIGLVAEISRCSLDMKTCEKFNTRNFRDMCRRFTEKNAFYSKFFADIQPEWKCPIKSGNYVVNASIETSPVAWMPIDNYVWVITFKLVANDPGHKQKKTILCMNSETKIIRVNKKTK